MNSKQGKRKKKKRKEKHLDTDGVKREYTIGKSH